MSKRKPRLRYMIWDAPKTVDEELYMLRSALAWQLVGKLRTVNPDALTKLKRELREFSSSTGEWKEAKP